LIVFFVCFCIPFTKSVYVFFHVLLEVAFDTILLFFRVLLYSFTVSIHSSFPPPHYVCSLSPLRFLAPLYFVFLQLGLYFPHFCHRPSTDDLLFLSPNYCYSFFTFLTFFFFCVLFLSFLDVTHASVLLLLLSSAGRCPIGTVPSGRFFLRYCSPEFFYGDVPFLYPAQSQRVRFRRFFLDEALIPPLPPHFLFSPHTCASLHLFWWLVFFPKPLPGEPGPSSTLSKRLESFFVHPLRRLVGIFLSGAPTPEYPGEGAPNN